MDNCEYSQYCDYRNSRRLPVMIINYLKKNAPNFWKILKYEDRPYAMPDLTRTEINSMVCSEWSSDAVNKYFVIPTRWSGQALSKKSLQCRISILAGESPENHTTAQIRVMIETVCSQNTPLIQTDNGMEDRAYSLMMEVVNVINGASLPEIGTNLNMNGREDRNTGIRLVNFSDSFYGYSAVMSCIIT